MNNSKGEHAEASIIPRDAKPEELRFIPLINSYRLRIVIGLGLFIASPVLAATMLGDGQLGVKHLAIIAVFAWLPSIYLTDKYTHKYPQRYYSYLIASHLKSGILIALLLLMISVLADVTAAQVDVMWTGFALFVLTDALVSVPCRLDSRRPSTEGIYPWARESQGSQTDVSDDADTALPMIDRRAVIDRLPTDLDVPMLAFLNGELPDGEGELQDVLLLDDIDDHDVQHQSSPIALLIGRIRLNDIRRLNRFLTYCTRQISMGGYILIGYTPLEHVYSELRRQYRGFLFWPVFLAHFFWYRALPKVPLLEKAYFSPPFSWLDRLLLKATKRRNRMLPKAEVWGRLAFFGMEVMTESELTDDGLRYVLARRMAPPVTDRKPSFSAIAALEKVGLDGDMIHLHKIRSMYPFSEFLQKKIFESHGLTATGKFKDDFRLTDYGPFIRKYWLDELPQLFDWLRGEIKLVGMRATSPHFLSLYPKELIDLYVQIKPGLIPPIFDEETDGFDQIVEIELAYLRRYATHPVRTDLRYFYQTFYDIFFKGVRSK